MVLFGTVETYGSASKQKELEYFRSRSITDSRLIYLSPFSLYGRRFCLQSKKLICRNESYPKMSRQPLLPQTLEQVEGKLHTLCGGAPMILELILIYVMFKIKNVYQFQ